MVEITEQFIDDNFMVIKHSLLNEHSNVLKYKFKHFEFDRHAQSWLEVLGAARATLVSFFKLLCNLLPASTTTVEMIIDVISKKFMMYIALDKLLDILYVGKGAKPAPMEFNFDATDSKKVILRDAAINEFASIMIDMSFCDPVTQADKVIGSFMMASRPEDASLDWRDMNVAIYLESTGATGGYSTFNTSLKDFKFDKLADMIASVAN